MMPGRWRCVAFDFDGTLVDSLPALRRAYQAFLQAHAATGSDEEFERLNGPTIPTIVSRLKAWHGLAAPHDELLRQYYAHVARAYRDGVPPAEGAEDLLRWVGTAGRSRALVTSSPRAAVECVLERLGWNTCFDVVVCGDEVEAAKPHPAAYARACELGGWGAAECVAVEDAPAGTRAAAACGLDVIGVGPPERFGALRDSGATWTCESLGQVLQLLGEGTKHHGPGH